MPDMSNVFRFAPAALLVPLVIVVVLTPKFTPAAPPNPSTKPVLALELPRPGEVARLLGSQSAKDSAAANTRWDYGFIAAYTLLFLSFALAGTPAMRVAIGVVALATAAFDYWEDAIIMKFIGNPELPASDIWFAGQGKWFCFFLSVTLIALLFARAGKWWWVVAALLAVPGVIGAVAALMRHRLIIDCITLPAIGALILATLLIPFVPRRP